MKNFLSSLLATITGIIILTIIGFLIFMGIVSAAASSEVAEVEENSLLVAKFNSPINDRADDNPFTKLTSADPFGDDAMGLNQILKDLDKAEKDDRISGIFLKLRGIEAGMATLTEIRDAILDFKECGKFVYAYADSYTQKSYYLASVADSIFMTPEGGFLFSGLSSEVIFVKNALDKLGVDMQVVRHGSFKGAVEPLMRTDLSDENRLQIETYVGAIWDKYLEDVSKARDIPVDRLNAIADELIAFDSKKIMETGLIDGLLYYDEMLTLMKKRMDVEEEDDLEAIGLRSYKDAIVKDKEKKSVSRDKIAVVYAYGAVKDGDDGEGTISSERISRAIRKARRDKKVKAIVFRVNSGGGSALASDIIHREVELAAEVKPVVASMGDVAASGGYYVVAAADTILASPNTITGSIGVFGVFPNLKKMMNEKLGVTSDVVKTNKHSDILTVMDPLDSDERAIAQKMIDDTYVSFVNIVSRGRDLSYEEIDAIAQGRVWAGANALEIGLIDEFGGLEKAIETAAELAGLEDYRVSNLPTLDDPMTAIMKQLTGGAQMRAERILKHQLGEEYIHYRKLQEIKSMSGIQMRIPFEIEVQ